MAVSNEVLALCLLLDVSVDGAREAAQRQRAAQADAARLERDRVFRERAARDEEERRREAAEPFFTPARIVITAVAAVIAGTVMIWFQVAFWDKPGTSSRSTTAPYRSSAAGDLGLDVPMSVPDCDGMGIVVLASLVTPGRYEADVARALNRFPGSSYLRTDQSCSSLRQATEQGNPIYAVYRAAGYRPEQVCDAVRAAGGGAYGKWLNETTPASYIIPC